MSRTAGDLDAGLRRLSRAITALFVVFFLFGVLMGMVNGNTPLAVVCAVFAGIAGLCYWILGRPWLSDW